MDFQFLEGKTTIFKEVCVSSANSDLFVIIYQVYQSNFISTRLKITTVDT